MLLLTKENCSSLHFLARIGQFKWCSMNPIAMASKGGLTGQRKAVELLAKEKAGGQSRLSELVSEEALRAGAGLASPGRGQEGKLTLLS